MPSSPNLGIVHLDANAAQPEVPVDAAIDALDAKITGTVNIGIGASNVFSLTQAQQALGSIFVLADSSPGSSGAIVGTLATFGLGVFVFWNTTSHACSIKYSGQPAAAAVINPGQVAICFGNGVNIMRVV